MGLVLAWPTVRTTKEGYVIPLERPVVKPKEVPVIIQGKSYTYDELVETIRCAFAPYSQRAKNSVVHLFSGLPITARNESRFVEEKGEDGELDIFCPIGYAAYVDGISGVSACCLWQTAQSAWIPITQRRWGQEWERAKIATNAFINGWYMCLIDGDTLREALQTR